MVQVIYKESIGRIFSSLDRLPSDYQSETKEHDALISVALEFLNNWFERIHVQERGRYLSTKESSKGALVL